MNVSNETYKIDFDVFSYAIPFVSFVLDHSIKRVVNTHNNEKSLYVFLKLAFIVYYLGVYVMSLEIRGSPDPEKLNKFFVMSTINLILFPILSSVYSVLLFKGMLV